MPPITLSTSPPSSRSPSPSPSPSKPLISPRTTPPSILPPLPSKNTTPSPLTSSSTTQSTQSSPTKKFIPPSTRTRPKTDIASTLPLLPTGPLPKYTQPRGGVIVETCVGNLQFGMPPETIKDCLSAGLQVPQFFVVPTVSFVRQLGPNVGINVAEFEFPAYCNFFFYRRRVTLIVASVEVEERIRKVFQETLFGPANVDCTHDFPEGTPKENMPDLQRELDFFRVFDGRLMQIEDLLDFVVFDDLGVATITTPNAKTNSDNVVKLQWRTKGAHDDGEYIIVQDGYNCGVVGDQVILPEFNIPKTILSKVFIPPVFGVTVLGNSHGFDPVGRTSGYVVWLSRRGFMVDPPPQSTALLLANNIPPSLITGVIITHCHADHDAGTFQKILQEGRITLMTTQTIHDSFLRKYAALSGLDPMLLSKSFHFKPVKIGEHVKIRGGSFKFFYSLHAIPCVGFEVFLGDKSMVFSADHMNDPDKIRSLHADGVINDWRCKELLNFPWHRDVILHEAGIPPIHTPMSTLAALSDDIKKRLYIVHVSLSSFKPEYGLKPAPVGVENTIIVHVDEPENAGALEVLDLVMSIDLFSFLTMQHAREILQIAEVAHYKAGEPVIKQGDEGHSMMIIASGIADVRIKVMNREERLIERGADTAAGAGAGAGMMIGSLGSSSSVGVLPVVGIEEGDEEEEEDIDDSSSAVKSATNAENNENENEVELAPVKDKDSANTNTTSSSSSTSPSPIPSDHSHTSVTVKTFGAGDYFGEQALVAPDCIRSADIFASTDLTVYTFQRQDFNWLLHGTPVIAKIERMIMARQDAVWELMGMNAVLHLLTPTQKTQLEQRCTPRFIKQNDTVWSSGSPATIAVLIDSGKFRFVQTKKNNGSSRRAPSVFRHLGPRPPQAFEPGAFVGEIDALLENKPLQTTLISLEEGHVMVITKDDLLEFFTNAPGVLLSMLHTQFIMARGVEGSGGGGGSEGDNANGEGDEEEEEGEEEDEMETEVRESGGMLTDKMIEMYST